MVIDGTLSTFYDSCDKDSKERLKDKIREEILQKITEY